jgi:hypothetical protein
MIFQQLFINIYPGWAVQGSTFQVEKPPNSSYQRDFVFIVLIKPFHPRGMSGIPDLDQYCKQCPSLVTFEP